MAMKCPVCSTRGYIKDTRTRSDGKTLTRRYKCSKCPAKWTTTEMMVHTDKTGVPKDGRGAVSEALMARLMKKAEADVTKRVRLALGFKR